MEINWKNIRYLGGNGDEMTPIQVLGCSLVFIFSTASISIQLIYIGVQLKRIADNIRPETKA